MSTGLGVLMGLIEFFNHCQDVYTDLGVIDTVDNQLLNKAVISLRENISILADSADKVVSLLSKEITDVVEK